jgi:hypothetical protein
LGNLYGEARRSPTDQTKEEIASAATTEIARPERLLRNVDKAAEKKHIS